MRWRCEHRGGDGETTGVERGAARGGKVGGEPGVGSLSVSVMGTLRDAAVGVGSTGLATLGDGWTVG